MKYKTMPFQKLILNYNINLSERTNKEIIETQNEKQTTKCSRRQRFLY